MKKIYNFVLDIFPWIFTAVDWVCVYGVTEEIFNESHLRGLLTSIVLCICLDVLPSWASSKFNDAMLWKEDFAWTRLHILAAAAVFLFAFLVYVAFTLISIRSMLLEDPNSWVEAWGNIARALFPIATSIGSLWCGFRGTTSEIKKCLKELDKREDIIKAEIDEKTATIHRIEYTLAKFDPQEVDNVMYQTAVDRELSCMERAFWQVHMKLCEALESEPDVTGKIFNSEQAVKARINELRERSHCPEGQEYTAPNTAEGSTAKLPLSA